MNKHSFLIVIAVIGMTGYYTFVGQSVPQKEVQPPKDIQIRQTMTTAEMVDAGKDIFEGKGTCLACHKMTGGTRFPNMNGIGERAGSQKEGLNDIEYLAESLYEPNIFIVKGYNPGMPAINRPPVGLSDMEIKATIAFLQSLGGTPTIKMNTQLKYDSGAPTPAPTPVATAPSAMASSPAVDFQKLIVSTPEQIEKGKTLYAQCMPCHGVEGKGDGPASAAFNPKPRNFTQLEGWTKGSQISQIYQTLVEGNLPKGMPSFAQLSIEERFYLTHYLRSLNSEHPKDSEAELKAFDEKYHFSKGLSVATQIMDNFGCKTCHILDKPEKLLGPSLFDIGKRLNKALLYEALMDPDATVAKGFPPGVMSATLKANGFYNKVSMLELKELVDHLSAAKGN